jgi:aminoethylphosphonate catabolism LysR family transcriptional regulator
MNLTHVLAFHRVAAAGSFTLAARMSGVSQPTLSAQVRALEQTIGRALFERPGRRIRLTPAGETLLRATTHLAEAIAEVERVVAAPRAETRGFLRVSADSALHVIPVLADLKRKSKAFAFSLRIDNSAAVKAQVLNDEADVAVMAQPTDDPRLHAQKIRRDRLALLVARNHPWAGRKSVRIADLAGRDLVVRERGSITRGVIEASIEAARIVPGQVFDVATREAVREAVAAGFGAGIVFASEAGDDRRIVKLDFRGADLAVAEYAICLAERCRLGLVARFLDAAHRLAVANRWIDGSERPSRRA